MRYFLQILLFTIIFLTLHSSSLLAQKWNVTEYGLDDGLTQSQILSLFQDNKGNLWIGTNGGGINIYNGKTFTAITQKQGLVNDIVFSIAQDSKGIFYIGTNEGLSVYNGNTFKNFTEKDGLPDNRIFKIYVDENDVAWLGTQKGVIKFQNHRLVEFEDNKMLGNAPVYSIFKDKNKNYWFGTLGSGLFKYNSKSFEIFTAADSVLADNRIRTICQDPEGTVWIGTERGMNYYSYKTNKLSKIGGSNAIISLLVTSAGEFWIATRSGLLTQYKYQNKKDVIFRKDFSVFGKNNKTDKLWALLEDKEKNIWIASENGLKKFPYYKRFYNYNESDSLINNIVTCVFRSSSGEFWFGSPTMGILSATVDEEKVLHLKSVFSFEANDEDKKNKRKGDKKAEKKTPKTMPDKAKKNSNTILAGKYVSSIVEDKKNNIWIGTWTGITKYNGIRTYNYTNVEDKSKSKIFNRNLVSQTIYSLCADHKDNIWVGTNNGLSLISDTVFTNLNEQFIVLEKSTIFYIYEDTDKKIWICSDKGIFRIDGKNIKQFGVKERITEKGEKEDIIANSVIQDKYGLLWFGTKYGVFSYNKGTFGLIDEYKGLASNCIYLLILDDNENLFIGTNKGLDKINTKAFNISGKIIIEHYGKDEGFIGQECNINSCFKDKLGRLWFGTVKGVTVYDPKLIKINTVKPQTHILKLLLDFNDLDSAQVASYSDGPDSVTHLPVKLVLPYNKNNITFDFVATSLTIPKKVNYQYMLEGLNNEWSPSRNKSEADYQGLSDGKYVFKVRACNDDGVWNETPVTFSFIIKPPFWKTWWFYTILAILLIIGVVVYIRRREQKLIKEKQILEQKVKERTAEIARKNQVLQTQKEEIQKQADELEKLSIVASETDNAVVIMDGKGHFEWINEGFTKMYGYTLPELKAMLGTNILDCTGNQHLREIIDSGFDTREPIIYEALTHTKSGEKLWAQTTISPIFDKSGEVIKLVAIDSNIHKMKLAEEEIKQQKEEIEAQRDEISEQKKIVEDKNKDITDSINYAKNIQNAILPSLETIQKSFPEIFILFKPRDIVSGDFYWYNENEDYVYFAAVDCTGHGVPGAFMSMLGFAFLNEIVNKEDISEPNLILDKLRDQIVKSLHQEGKLTDSKDGMDTVLIIINKHTNQLQFSGANNPLYLIRNGELIEYKGEKMPIAYHLRMDPFKKQVIDLMKGDTLYFFSDGFADQFGGPKGKKFMYKHLKELVMNIQDNTMSEQKNILNYTLEQWKSYINPENGNPYSQIDDILIIGVRI
ncbi:MAG: SpoIIE family protein phosphatase [Bacteroidia bacterium]|nr:SpoIIE family protein phosphatase [Bacteroidia bacterium]